MESLLSLPTIVLIQIFSYLDFEHRINLMFFSKRFFELCCIPGIPLHTIKIKSAGFDNLVKLTVMFSDDPLEKFKFYVRKCEDAQSSALKWTYNSRVGHVPFPNYTVSEVILILLTFFLILTNGKLPNLVIKMKAKKNSQFKVANNRRRTFPKSARKTVKEMFLQCEHIDNITFDCEGPGELLTKKDFDKSTHLCNLFRRASKVDIDGGCGIPKQVVRSLSASFCSVPLSSLTHLEVIRMVELWSNKENNVSPYYVFKNVQEVTLKNTCSVLRTMNRVKEWTPFMKIYRALLDDNGRWPYEQLTGFQIQSKHIKNKVASLIVDVKAKKIFFMISYEPYSEWPLMERVNGMRI